MPLWSKNKTPVDINKRTHRNPSIINKAKTLIIAWVLWFSSCDGSYPNNQFNFSSNSKEIRWSYNIQFIHSESSAGSHTDNYNIDLHQTNTWYVIKINDDKFNVNNIQEAQHTINHYILKKEDDFVHKKYINKSISKTANFIEQFNKYKDDPNRASTKSVSLKNGKIDKEIINY